MAGAIEGTERALDLRSFLAWGEMDPEIHFFPKTFTEQLRLDARGRLQRMNPRELFLGAPFPSLSNAIWRPPALSVQPLWPGDRSLQAAVALGKNPGVRHHHHRQQRHHQVRGHWVVGTSHQHLGSSGLHAITLRTGSQHGAAGEREETFSYVTLGEKGDVQNKRRSRSCCCARWPR